MPKYSKQEAYARATALCSRGEKCVSDLYQKLRDWQVEEDFHHEIIQALLEDKYIDEERFALYFSQDKCRFNGWGKIKIRHHLLAKGIAKGLIDKALDGIDEKDYARILLKTLQGKNRTLKDANAYERRQKLMRFGLGRGFSAEEIKKAFVIVLSPD